MAHVFKIALIEILSLLSQEEVYQLVVAFQVSSTIKKQSLSILALLWEHAVHRVFVQTVDKFDEIVLKETELLKYGDLERIETLLDKHLFAILSSQGEDVDDNTPARLDVGSLSAADVRDAHDDILFDISSRRQIVQHNLLERHQEVFLEVEACELVLDQELVCELSK